MPQITYKKTVATVIGWNDKHRLRGFPFLGTGVNIPIEKESGTQVKNHLIKQGSHLLSDTKVQTFLFYQFTLIVLQYLWQTVYLINLHDSLLGGKHSV